ncbi:hypothetical protein PIB30_054749 [Stylosanthes scabra]|uniref:Secreted protein n=1 Tax=Stylosanthes scabra TaxID=79078 RepID=A0ABU6TIM9_9FABA|nr:hypothetical protein [Stylosanthes scabra]
MTVLFVLVFRSSADALVRHLPHRRLRLSVVSSTSTAPTPETAGRAATRLQKLTAFLIRAVFCRHLSASFCPSSRRTGLSPPPPLSLPHRHESNKPSFVPRSHSTRPHAPPEGRCSTLFAFLQKLQ